MFSFVKVGRPKKVGGDRRWVNGFVKGLVKLKLRLKQEFQRAIARRLKVSRRMFPRFLMLFCGVLLGLSLVLWPRVSQGLTVQEVPNPRQESGGWVTDMANVLSEETEQRLNRMITGLEAQNGAEIAVVTVPNTSSEATPKAFATRLFNHWGIGKADVDNGVLWLHSVGDRRIEIETGYGVEGILPDAQVAEIIDEVIIPEFRKDHFDAGTLAGIEPLITVLSGEEFQGSGDASNSVSDSFLYRDGLDGFGLATLVCWIAAVSGYRTIRQRLRNPIQLDPRGQSRVMERGDYILYKGLLATAAITGFALCLGGVIPLIILDYKIAWLMIGMLLGIGVVKAILVWGQYIIDSVKASLRLEGGDRYISLFKIVVKLFIDGLVLMMADMICRFMLIPLYVDLWREDLEAILVFSCLASLCLAWLAHDLAKPWIQGMLTIVCRTCQSKLLLVPEGQVDEKLNHPQTVAKELGSTLFKGLSCPNCTPDVSDFHLRSYRLKPKKFDECPVCEEFTVTHTRKILVKPTSYITGLEQKNYRCQVCDYSNEEQIIIPRRSRSVSGGSAGIGGSSGGCGGGGC